MQKKYIYGNWKMAQPLAAAKDFIQNWNLPAKENVEVCVFPSFVHLESCVLEAKRKSLSLFLGGQDCSTEEKGAFTGEVSASMLKEMGATHVLVGHSERRQRAGETNETLSQKLKQALAQGLMPVFCLGETEEQREQGKVFETFEFQLKALKGISQPLLMAYEPVWAIGTGKTASLEDIKEAHDFLKKKAPSNVLGTLYGGSVKPENAKEILSIPHVDGLLVGGASLDLNKFKNIVESAY